VINIENLKILLVDDKQEDLELLLNILVNRGLVVETAQSGQGAIDIATAILPDLILLDIWMPDLSGFEVCQRLKANQYSQDIPVIFLSAINQITDKLTALRVGGCDYITKPFHPEEVLLRIEHQLQIQTLQKQLKVQNERLSLELAAKERIATELNDRNQQIESILETVYLVKEITNEIRSELDTKKILETAAIQIGKALGVSRALIHIYIDEETPKVPILGEFLVSGYTSLINIEISVAGNPHLEAVLSQDSAFASADVYVEPLLSNALDICRELQIKSMLAVRTSYKGKPNGMICLHQCDRKRSWTLLEIELLESIAAQLGIALSHAKLLELEKQAKIELQQGIERTKLVEGAKIALETKLASAFRSSPDPIALTTFPDVRYIEVNDHFCRLFGYTREQVIGRSAKNVDIWVDIGDYTRIIQILRENQAILNHEIEFRTASGLRTMLLSAEVIFIDGQQHLLCTARDITSRKQAENESRLLLLTTQAISRALDVDTALSLVLRLICTTIGWDFAEAWTPSEAGELEYNLGWYGEGSNLERFCRESENIKFACGEGLSGRVWQNKQPEWIEDVSSVSASVFLRNEVASVAGLKAGFAVPILAVGEVLVVLIFFKRTKLPIDRRLLYLVSTVAAQLGVLIQRKQAEIAHRHSEERLQLALDASELGMWDWDLVGGKIYRDWRWKRMLGYTEDEIADTEEAFRFLLHPEDIAGVSKALQSYLHSSSQVYKVIFRMRAKSGEWKWIESCGKIFERDERGKPLRLTGTHKDISEQQQAEEKLRLVTERLQYLLTSSLAVIFSCEPSGDFGNTFISENVAAMVGYDKSEFLEDSGFWLRHVHPEDVELVRSNILLVFTQESSAYEYRFLHKDGTYRWFYEQMRLIRDDAGSPIECVGYCFDISDRKRTELELQTSQRRYQILTEASPVGIFQCDIEGNCFYFNQRWCEITGMSFQSGLSKGWTNALHPDERLSVFAAWNQAMSAKSLYNLEHRFIRPDGTTVWVIAQAVPEIGEDGEVKGYVGTVTDVTSLKLAQDALHESAARERAVTQAIQRMRQTLDLETIFTATTQELRQVLLCDRVVVYRFNPNWSGEFVAESVGDGWVSLIEAHKQDPNFTEGALLEDACVVQAMNSNANQVIDTHLQDTQGGAYSRGTSFLCVPDIYKAGFEECYIQLLERFQAKAYVTVPIFCGSQIWGLLGSYQNSSPRQWKVGEINIVVQIGNQLGVALQQAELLAQTQLQSQALQRAVIAADAANRAKSEFLANMSHELRTPLNAILGFTQLMSHETEFSEENQENLAIINRAGEHLLSLINDILEMSKIEAGRSDLNISNFNLIRLLDNLREMLQYRATAKGLTLIFEYSSDIPSCIQTDASKLRQVLLNLLGNAIKFTTTGSVILRVGMKDGGDKGDKGGIFSLSPLSPPPPTSPTLHFEVIDTGSGISPTEIKLLFEAFAQTETGRQSQQGTGLGLAISRKYVQLMGGDITVSSTVNVGSTFAFDIQISFASEGEVCSASDQRQIIRLVPEQPTYRILVVDDADDSRVFLVKLLSLIGFAVQEAINGVDAISVWSNWQPHLILMDMRMPIMDGYEATRQIKALESQGHSIHNNQTIIVALTANAFDEQRDAIITSGCDDFINKPFHEQLLLEKIQHYLNVEYIYQAETAHVNRHSWQVTQSNLSDTNIVELLSPMSPIWLEEMYNAAASCSDDLILHLLEQISSENASLAEFLNDLTRNFHFEKIMELARMAIDNEVIS
jgi:two-component system sensor histidine kinase/response regulator